MSKGKIISFISAPGGVGKTTVALCIAWFLKQRNNSTLLIDMDPSLGLTLNLKDFREYKIDIEDKKKTTADLLEITMKASLHSTFDFKWYLSNTSFQDITLEFIASSIRLEDVMGKIWHTTMAGPGEKKLKQALGYIPEDIYYDYILIDSIPCYSLNYALMTVFASDACIVPLRLTINDLGRTISIMKKLLETVKMYEMSEKEFFNKIMFLFNRVDTQYHHEKKIPSYIKELREALPKAKIFDKYISKQMGFIRIGTREEKSGDRKNVKDSFKPFFEDFKNKM